MKSLTTIQKTFRVFQVLTKIAMILSFVWAGVAVLGVACGMVWQNGGMVIGANRELFYSMTETDGLRKMIYVLLADTVFALTDGILLAGALRYFKAEQADGTPFTYHGAVQIRKLGIRTIVLPLVANIVAAVLYAVSRVPEIARGDWGSEWGISMGIVLILASLIFQYGADLEEKVK